MVPMKEITQYFISSEILQFLFHTFIIVVSIILINSTICFTLKIVDNKFSKKSPIVFMLYHATYRPVNVMVWILGIWIVVTQLITWEHHIAYQILGILSMVTKVLEIVCLTWVLIRFSKTVKEFYTQKKKRISDNYNDLGLIETMHKILQFLILVMSFLLILGALKIPLAALAGMTTIIAAFLAISQQELIKNLFGGIMMYLDGPFSIGDMIQTETGSIEGTVEKISFRLTVVRRSERRPMYIPNAIFLTTPIINTSRMTNRRILQYLNIRYCDLLKMPDILESIRNMLKQNISIDHKRPIIVAMINGKTNMGSITESAFGSYALNFMFSAFTKTTNREKFHSIQDDILMKTVGIIHNYKANIAFPTILLDDHRCKKK